MENTQFPHLFQPLRIGNVTLKNRIVASPSSQGDVNHDGTLNEHNIAYYARKARGGAALVTVGDGIVHPTGQDHPYQVFLYTDDCLPSLTRCAEEIHKYGALCSYELSHGGIVCDPAFIGGQRPYGPSEVPVTIGFQTDHPVTVTTQEMTREFMEELADTYAAAAARCKLAGFDMVMVHAAHGWLIGQFFSPYVNHRTDEFGGSIENRCRFAVMVLKKIRAAVGKGFPIDFRINGRDGMDEGLSLEDSLEICKTLEPYVDSFHVSSCFHSIPSHQDIMQSPIFEPRGHLLHLAAAVKQVVRVPVTTVGGFSDPAMMEDVIASGKADIVALGRQMLADPDLPKKAQRGDAALIRPCQRCANCQSGRFTRQTARCTVNPEIGREYELQFMPPKAPEKRKILIAGGGPGGMQAAITAARRGHDVTLYEASDRLGGALNFAQYVPFKCDLFGLVKTMERELAALPVKVVLNTPLTPEKARAEAPDELIIALGADLLRPRFPGSEGENVLMAEEADRCPERVGARVAVIGGGQVGIETAIHQAQLGKQVTIIEGLDTVGRDANFRYKRTYQYMFERLGIETLTGALCTEITPESVVCERGGARVTVPADTAVIAIGMRPRRDAAEAFLGCAPEVRILGNCAKVGQTMDAIRAGFDAGMFVD